MFDTATKHFLCLAFMIGPVTLCAGQPTPPSSDHSVKFEDVELSAAGELSGQFLTSVGIPIQQKPLEFQIGTQHQRVLTDESGRFVVTGLHGGQCTIRTQDDVFVCRVWAHGTAPPGSVRSVAIVTPAESEVRGQSFLNRQRAYFSRSAGRLSALTTKQKVILGLLVTAGTTIAIVESEDDGS